MRREGSRRGERRRKEGSRNNHMSEVCAGERKTRGRERERDHFIILVLLPEEGEEHRKEDGGALGPVDEDLQDVYCPVCHGGEIDE